MYLDQLYELGFKVEPTSNGEMTNIMHTRRFRINGKLVFVRKDDLWIETIERHHAEDAARLIVTLDFPSPHL